MTLTRNLQQVFKRGLATAAANTATIDHRSLVLVDRKRDSSVVTLRLNSRPVNSLSLEFLNEMNGCVESIEQDESVSGVIIASSINGIYSAGVELSEIYRPNKERCALFSRALQNLWIKLYGSKKVYVAGINGQAIAGGCVIALACDYRLMANGGKFKIGLNESILGIQPPFWLCEMMRNTIGHRNAEKALEFGELYSPEEALKLNLVDRLVDAEKLDQEAEEIVLRLSAIPGLPRKITKLTLRRPLIEKLVNVFDVEADTRVEYLTQPYVQSFIGDYLAKLKSKKNNV